MSERRTTVPGYDSNMANVGLPVGRMFGESAADVKQGFQSIETVAESAEEAQRLLVA